MQTIDYKLVELALDHVVGSDFEKFAQAFIAATGHHFVPLGGQHDGGADGLFHRDTESSPKHFMQASTQQDFRGKIRDTVRRLKVAGRQPSSLTYYTSRSVPLLDKEEQDLGDQLGITVKIRDRRFISSNINNNEQSIQAFQSFLAPHISFLNQIGGNNLIPNSPNLPARALCVFLSQEVERRRGNTQLLEAVADSLVLWALEGTDPEKGLFLNRDEILQRVQETLPAAKKFFGGVIDTRLALLSSKQNPNGREIRKHTSKSAPDPKYCLTHVTRQLIYTENAEDETLRSDVSEIFRLRAEKQELNNAKIEQVIAVCHRALTITFEKQGLEVATFISSPDIDSDIQTTIADNIDIALEEVAIPKVSTKDTKTVCLSLLRKTFYDSTELERKYLAKLSRTYALLFVIKNEPRIVEYFRNMSGKFVLYVGSDLVVRALSERYLKNEDRMLSNLFKILRAAGSELILSENALQEVISHLRVSDIEFRKNYNIVENVVNPEFVRHIDKILIRSYFYARLEPDKKRQRPTSWPAFINQFCTYEVLNTFEGQESLGRTLCEEFEFRYEQEEELRRGVDPEELQEIVRNIRSIRQRPNRTIESEDILAENDALHALKIYARRSEKREANRSNPYGYTTWWMTQESWVRQATAKLVQRNGAQYMIRPEFLLNFIALNPSLEEVRASFELIFPSLLGVKLSNRMREDVFKRVVEDVKKNSELGEGRARAYLSELSDRLKGDYFKQYEIELSRGLAFNRVTANSSHTT